MNTMFQNVRTIGIVLAIIVVALLSSVVIVPETHQAVVIRTGSMMR